MISVVLVDDQPSTRAVLRLRLELEADISVTGETENNDDTVAQVVALSPDVVILDVAMPIRDGSSITTLLRTLAMRSAVIVFSLYDDPATRALALAAGAWAVISKHETDDCVLAEIRAAADPQAYPRSTR